jgi:hypothetical protein
MVTHLVGHGELNPVGPMETLAGHEAVKIVATLEVPSSGTEGKSADGSMHHRIIVFLVCLEILAIFDAAMLGVVFY